MAIQMHWATPTHPSIKFILRSHSLIGGRGHRYQWDATLHYTILTFVISTKVQKARKSRGFSPLRCCYIKYNWNTLNLRLKCFLFRCRPPTIWSSSSFCSWAVPPTTGRSTHRVEAACRGHTNGYPHPCDGHAATRRCCTNSSPYAARPAGSHDLVLKRMKWM